MTIAYNNYQELMERNPEYASKIESILDDEWSFRRVKEPYKREKTMMLISWKQVAHWYPGTVCKCRHIEKHIGR